MTEQKLKCPVCGFIARRDAEGVYHQSLLLGPAVAPYCGVFCLRCYAKFLATHVPRMVPVESQVEKE